MANTVNIGILGKGTVGGAFKKLLEDRADMVEEARRIAPPIVDVWASLPARDFPNYPAGSWGPQAGDALIQRDGRQWWQPH